LQDSLMFHTTSRSQNKPKKARLFIKLLFYLK
jgi:hypothetical protein